MKITNTLTKQKEDLVPLTDNKINMFVCGPTVYDYIHIGNARTFVFFDVVAKYLRFKGFDVNYIQNITDIDNKIIDRAAKESVDSLEYAKKYTEIFKQDVKDLGVTAPEYKNATDHIPEVIKQVQSLLDNDSAYLINNDGIYFDLSTFPDYGKLSGRTANMADDAVSRIDDSDKKRNRGDFALWKFSPSTNSGPSATDDPSWPAPFGSGRPGWHIEDTAITEKYFGPQYDIHGGGQDLIFPHHEAEIAQQESASGLKPFVKYWLHVAFLINKESKMSKSLGNFDTVHSLLENYSPEALRFYLLSAHYRTPLDYSLELLKQSVAAVGRITEFLTKLKFSNATDGNEIDNILELAKNKFESAMDDDFNIPSALAALFELISRINILLEEERMSKTDSDKIRNFLLLINNVLGIVIEPEIKTKESDKFPGIKITSSLGSGIKLSSEIYQLAEKSAQARKEGNYLEADKLRKQLHKKGFDVENRGNNIVIIINKISHR